MLVKVKKRVIKFEKSIPFLRIFSALFVTILAASFHKIRPDVLIIIAAYLLSAYLELACADFMKNNISKYNYYNVSLDLAFITGVVLITGGSASACWPFYMAVAVAFAFNKKDYSGLVASLMSVVFYLSAIYYSEGSLKDVPLDFIAALFLVTPLITFLIYRDKQAAFRITTVDTLTKAYNLGYFRECLDRAVKNHESTGEPVSLLFIDVDNFKTVNDTYGHMRGDQVLKAVGQAILLAIRKQDMVFRYGGDEFAVILHNSSREEALRVAERISKNVNRSVDGMTTFMKVTVSVGVAVLDEDLTDNKMLLEAADKALYEAKKQGKNRVAIYSDTKPDRLKNPLRK
ncbi:GGDEF domain-containing protein [Pelotomaculum propionicicum]|uniref:GGDEF domain-containing protein n=1 Tax=Pelotomaculum propionicicum TaxID=258475 RepID=UPI003B80CA16